MPLSLIAVPIGHPQDITLRALEALKASEVIIVEERKEATQWLRAHGITGRNYETLNEHSTKEDLARLVDLCVTKDVALITDCGTPGFCDPGADLVNECRRRQISVRSLPGASSLMMALSLSSQRLNQFVFRGFLSAESEQRRRDWLALKMEKRAVILMDTPYRLSRTLDDLVEHLPHRQILLGLNLTQADEQILEGAPQQVRNQVTQKKAEFIVLVYPT